MAKRATFRGSDEDYQSSRKGIPEADLDITPMIDVTFLLLIFFMVSSTMQNEKEVDVPVADHGVGVETRTSGIINVYAEDPEPVIEIETFGMDATLDDVESQVEEWVAQNADVEIIIKAERDVPSGFVSRVLRSVTKTEGVKFSIGVRDRN